MGNQPRKILGKLFIAIILAYISILGLLYFSQEKLLFHPTKLPKDYQYPFDSAFEEINIKADGDVEINTLLFKAENPKGAVLFLHGNGGAIHGWGQGAGLYTGSGFDVLYVDYRGYGKSGGSISSQGQLVGDCQKAYDFLKDRYGEGNIVVAGTSMGTGIASELAKRNHPKKLILVAPYYSLVSLVREKIKIVPGFLVKYKFKTNENLKEVDCPVVIFHGDEDGLIPVEHSKKLLAEHPSITLNIMEGYGHNNVPESRDYVQKVKAELAEME